MVTEALWMVQCRVLQDSCAHFYLYVIFFLVHRLELTMPHLDFLRRKDSDGDKALILQPLDLLDGGIPRRTSVARNFRSANLRHSSLATAAKKASR